jgi:hypothetical protein
LSAYGKPETVEIVHERLKSYDELAACANRPAWSSSSRRLTSSIRDGSAKADEAERRNISNCLELFLEQHMTKQ